MDEIVRQALAKWPDVPHCTGWLLLDRRGQWFFQNGPQRVYVELGYTPWVVRLLDVDGRLRLTDHAGADFEPKQAWLDDEGGVLLADSSTPPRVAALHDHDLEIFADHATLADGVDHVFHWRPGVDV